MMECCSHIARLAVRKDKFHSGLGSVTLGKRFVPPDLSLLICLTGGLIPHLAPSLAHWEKQWQTFMRRYFDSTVLCAKVVVMINTNRPDGLCLEN